MSGFPIKLADRHKVRRCPKHLATSKDVRSCDRSVWEKVQTQFHPRKVFVNIPYFAEYYPLRAAITATLDCVDMIPVFADGRSEAQPFRLCKICELMQTTKYCVSDVSRLHLQNMPFELGYFLGLGRQGHTFILTDDKFCFDSDGRKVKKFDAHFSDLTGTSVIYHENKPEKLATGLLARIRGDVPEARAAIQEVGDQLTSRIIERAAYYLRALKEQSADEILDIRSRLGRKRPPVSDDDDEQ